MSTYYRIAEIAFACDGAFPSLLIDSEETFETKQFARNKITILKSKEENEHKEYTIIKVYY